jgi:glycosyltransferase involved in cell wall biosynthesis
VTSALAIIPAYQAAATIAEVVSELRSAWQAALGETPRVSVVNDGSTDATSRHAQQAGAEVLEHPSNRGKGAALRTGLSHAAALNARVAVTLDADAQHPASEALRVFCHSAPSNALVLGVRDLIEAGAPRPNQFSNAFSNAWLSAFAGRKLLDTQCGLRRYPVRETLSLGARANGFGFEAEVLLRAARAGWPIEHLPVRVIYPPAGVRTTHFHPWRDPFRIVLRVIYTAATAGSK